MKTSTYRINGLAILLTLVLAGAASVDIGSEAGNWDYADGTAKTKADAAAQNYEYDVNALNKVGTEAGNWEYRDVAPQTPADIASQDYLYNDEVLRRTGSEAGDWEYIPANSGRISSRNFVEKDDQKTLCSNC